MYFKSVHFPSCYFSLSVAYQYFKLRPNLPRLHPDSQHLFYQPQQRITEKRGRMRSGVRSAGWKEQVARRTTVHVGEDGPLNKEGPIALSLTGSFSRSIV